MDTDFCCPVIGRFAGCPVSAGRALGKGGVQWREERKSRCESTRFGKTTTLKNQLRSGFGPSGEYDDRGFGPLDAAGRFLRVTNET